jgi:hypothetical protein
VIQSRDFVDSFSQIWKSYPLFFISPFSQPTNSMDKSKETNHLEYDIFCAMIDIHAEDM